MKHQSLLLLLLAFFGFFFFVLAQQQPAVKTSIGTIQGIARGSTNEFLGIPFGNASVRWRPAVSLIDVPLTSDGSPFNATQFGDCCQQVDLGLYIPTQSEQCLNLNVFTSAKQVGNAPVMFWIYGGGGLSGCSAQSLPALYNGSNIIMNTDPSLVPPVVVSINYRLGVFSSLYLPELVAEDPNYPTAGNLDYTDIQLALRWVKAHIADFGGDPNNILIFGESAGGNYAQALPISPNSTGLFQHILSESATGFNIGGFSNISSGTSVGYQIASLAGCDQSSSILDCLRSTDASVLIEAFQNVSWSGTSVIDGYILPLYPSIALAQGQFMNVTVIQGNNLPDNWPACSFLPYMNSTVALALAEAQLPLWGLNPINTPQVLATYELATCSSDPSAPPSQRCCSILTNIFLDFMMVCNARRLFQGAYTTLGQRSLWWYRFDCDPTCPGGAGGNGVCQHTSEIAYVFGTESNYAANFPGGDIECSWNASVREFSNQVINNWVSFSTSGMPFDDQWLPYVPPASSSSSTSIYYDITPYADFQAEVFVDDSKCDMFDVFEAQAVAAMFPNEVAH